MRNYIKLIYSDFIYNCVEYMYTMKVLAWLEKKKVHTPHVYNVKVFDKSHLIQDQSSLHEKSTVTANFQAHKIIIIMGKK